MGAPGEPERIQSRTGNLNGEDYRWPDRKLN
jgi:hypothetical protein